MIRAIIVEDQPPAQRILQKYAEDIGTIEVLGVFSDAIKAMSFLQKETVDLMFLDIHLPKLSGIEFLKSQSHLPQVILTTAFSDYALESYEYQVVDYLLKPFSFARFVQAVQKVETGINHTVDMVTSEGEEHSSPAFIMLKSGHDLIKIILGDIRYIQSDSDYTEIYTSGGKYLSNNRLKYWNETLPKKEFCQIHKSIIINIAHLTKITGNVVYLGEKHLSIGRAYKEELLNKLDN